MTMPITKPRTDGFHPPLPAMQRARGEGRLSVKEFGGRTRIDRLFQEGAAKIRLPRRHGGEGLEAVLINTAGGLTGGDRMRWSLEAASGTCLSVTTQACEKTYKADPGQVTQVSVSLRVGEGAALAWLPQETIFFDRAALSRQIDVEMAPDARLLLVEPVVFGRLAMGESVATGTFRDRWRVRRGGHLVHAEEFAIGPQVGCDLSAPAIAGGNCAMASLLLIAEDAADRLEAARALIGAAGGVSAWSVGTAGTGKLLARLVAADSYELRKTLVPLVRLINGEAALPRIWSI